MPVVRKVNALKNVAFDVFPDARGRWVSTEFQGAAPLVVVRRAEIQENSAVIEPLNFHVAGGKGEDIGQKLVRVGRIHEYRESLLRLCRRFLSRYAARILQNEENRRERNKRKYKRSIAPQKSLRKHAPVYRTELLPESKAFQRTIPAKSPKSLGNRVQ